jgi:hypothetical protein
MARRSCIHACCSFAALVGAIGFTPLVRHPEAHSLLQCPVPHGMLLCQLGLLARTATHSARRLISKQTASQQQANGYLRECPADADIG